MHDIWNPWHGCIKKSEGCENCYMYYLDYKHGKNGSNIYKSNNNFYYPIKKKLNGEYQIKSGELIRVCMTSDFFLEEADEWRFEAWQLIASRKDVKFYILTKRPERIMDNLPSDWNEGYENVILNVTCENQRRVEERMPIFMKVPAKHKGVMVAPFIGEVSLHKYLNLGNIEQVICGGENYNGSRICNFEWVKKLANECKEASVNFSFIETGTYFVKDKKLYIINNEKTQSIMAYKANLNFVIKDIKYQLYNKYGDLLLKEDLYIPFYKESCNTCGSKLICNGCSNCGKCK
jgi:gp37Gp68 family protein